MFKFAPNFVQDLALLQAVFHAEMAGSYEKKLKGMQKEDPELYKELMAGDITPATEEFHQGIGQPKKKEPGVNVHSEKLPFRGDKRD
ncbi:hypothetical protein DdX_22213 [Ditylenchus destructor]|uniref:Uncharacterized protein n=1 Tax=Ditylenchus destructor TaxID=166010 RepID=A0AAD4QR06_9BILA|nr:hypothetical protein DdX_22213 [Ditylenchus destructor]